VVCNLPLHVSFSPQHRHSVLEGIALRKCQAAASHVSNATGTILDDPLIVNSFVDIIRNPPNHIIGMR